MGTRLCLAITVSLMLLFFPGATPLGAESRADHHPESPRSTTGHPHDASAVRSRATKGVDRAPWLAQGREGLGPWDSRIVSFKNSWTWWAVRSQREMEIDEPISNTMHIGTHNSYNAFRSGYRIPNQFWSLQEQLELGARAVELDVNNDYHPDTLILCHQADKIVVELCDPIVGEYCVEIEIYDGTTCSEDDMRYPVGMEALRQWLVAPENSREVVLLDIEDWAEGPGNRPQMVAPLEAFATPGGSSMVFRPQDRAGLGRWPSRAELLRMGKRLIVFDHGDDTFYANPNDPPYSTARDGFKGSEWSFSTDDEAYNLAREGMSGGGSLNLAPEERENAACFNLIQGDRLPAGSGKISAGDLPVAVSSNWNVVQMDYLAYEHKEMDSDWKVEFCFPVVDVCIEYDVYDLLADLGIIDTADLNQRGERLTAAVWSWAPSDPAPLRARPDPIGLAARANGHDVALLVAAGFAETASLAPWRWLSVGDTFELGPISLDLDLRFACVSRDRDEDGRFAWRLSAARGKWLEGNAICRAEFPDTDGMGYSFGGPVNGYQNLQLTELIGARLNPLDAMVWINVEDLGRTGAWTVNRSPVTRLVGPPDGTLHEGDVLVVGDEDPTTPLGRALLRNAALVFDGTESNDADRLPGPPCAGCPASIYRDDLTFSWAAERTDPSSPPIALDFGPGSAALPDDGVYEFALAAYDGHPAGHDESRVVATVLNVPPEVRILAFTNELGQLLGSDTAGALEHLVVDATVSIGDPGILDTHTATADWGDGSPTENLGSVEDPFHDSHVFDRRGDYLVIFEVTDDDGGAGSDAEPVRVLDVMEAIDIATEELLGIRDDPTSEIRLRRLIDEAVHRLRGHASGRAADGARDLLDKDDWNGALEMVEQAQRYLAEADPSMEWAALRNTRWLLVLAAKSQALDLVLQVEQQGDDAGAERRARDARLAIAEGDSHLTAGDCVGAVGAYRRAVQRAFPETGRKRRL